jgi:hypothetical protein
MTAKRKPKKAALVLTDDDRAVLSSLPDDKRAMVEDMMRRHAGLTATEALQALRAATFKLIWYTRSDNAADTVFGASLHKLHAQ